MNAPKNVNSILDLLLAADFAYECGYNCPKQHILWLQFKKRRAKNKSRYLVETKSRKSHGKTNVL